MSYDEFFTDGDKPFAENLNDSLILLDAFNVTVPVEMPTMFSNGQFSSTVDVSRKAGIAIVTLKSVGSGITVGTSSISGTGDIVFRVYPNFNSFYKWQSIILEKTGTVSIGFKTTDGTSISATVNIDGVISEASALKTLQPIDVTLTLTSATITSILINFINNQQVGRIRAGALIDATQLNNVDTALSGSSTNVLQNKVIKTALDGKANSSHSHTESEIRDLQAYVLLADLATVATSGSYNDLSDKPYIDGAYVHPSTKQCNYEYVHPSTKQCNYVYTHPTTKQCNASIPEAYVHPSSKQCNYSYTHPTTKQCNAVIPAAYTHPSSKQCNYVYSHPAAQQCSHDHSTWTSVSQTNGTLYVNPALRLCELYFKRAGITMTSSYANYGSVNSTYAPKVDKIWCSTSYNTTTAYIDSSGGIYGNSQNQNTVLEFNAMWHY